MIGPWGLDPTLWGIGCALVAGLVAALHFPWLTQRGHRVPEDEEYLNSLMASAPEPDAQAVRRERVVSPFWSFVPAALALPMGMSRAAQQVHPVVILTMAVVLGLLGVLSVIDLDVHRLPNAFTYPMVLAVATVLMLVAGITNDWPSWRRAFLAGAALGLAYLALVLLGRGAGMGLGDAKLAPTLGMLLGWLSWGSVVLATMLTFLVGGLAAAVLLVMRRANGKTPIPFGPSMALGAALVWAMPGLTGIALG